MNLLNTYLNKLSNFFFEKINTITILDNLYNYTDFITKKINNFELNKFKFYLFGSYNLKKLKQIKDNLYIINKIFEGNNSNIDIDNFYNNLGILNYIKYNKKYCYYSFNYYKSYKCECNDIISFYNLGLIFYPLTIVNFYSSNSYIYNIYRYINIRSGNNYKSCLISLFYYYSGLLFSLICLYGYDDIKVLNSNLSVIVSKLSSFVVIINSYYSNIISNSLIPIKLINIINNSLYLCNINICKYRPYLIGLTKYTLKNSGVLSKLSFQETLKTLKTLVLDSKVDWNVDSKSNIILSKFIPSGSGWYRYFIN